MLTNKLRSITYRFTSTTSSPPTPLPHPLWKSCLLLTQIKTKMTYQTSRQFTVMNLLWQISTFAVYIPYLLFSSMPPTRANFMSNIHGKLTKLKFGIEIWNYIIYNTKTCQKNKVILWEKVLNSPESFHSLDTSNFLSKYFRLKKIVASIRRNSLCTLKSVKISQMSLLLCKGNYYLQNNLQFESC